MENNFSQAQMVNDILRVGHGDLSIYNEVGLRAAEFEPELLAHLIAWNERKGEIRDSKVALPIISLRADRDDVLFENSAAHLCKLSARDLVRACRYHRDLPRIRNGGAWWLKEAIELYVKHREQNVRWWDKTALQHRKSLKTLYAMYHIEPSPRANRILFKRNYPENSVFARVKELKNMKPQEAAGTILNFKIPFLVAVGALGGIKGKSDIVLALIEQMSTAELINNSNMLKRWGVMDSPELKSAYEKGLTKKQKVSTLKAGKAAKVVGGRVGKKLQAVQEKKLDTDKIKGDWLVLGDRSGSMENSIEVARQVAGFLARKVDGQVHLVFFNTRPNYYNVTAKSLDRINEETSRLRATGGTAIGCGLQLILEKNILVNGIAVCSDGGDNTSPYFHQAYERYVKAMGIEPTVYLYHVPGEINRMIDFCARYGVMVEMFELGFNVDYYSIPQIAQTMRANRYSLVEEIMEQRLLTFKDVFKGGV